MNFTPSISRMTLGTVQLGLNYGVANIDGKPDEEKACRILESAFASGVNCIDTAADYGDSEKVIGNCLKTLGKKRSDLIIVTKFKLGKIDKSEAESAIMRSFERSLKNLNTNYVDFLLIHDAREYAVFHKEILKAFEVFLKQGILKAAGASCYEFKDIAPMLPNEMFSAFQVPVNLLDMRITGGEAAQNLRDKIVFARSVFLQGLFFLDPAKLKGNLKAAEKYILSIKELASELKISVARLAATYVKSLSYVDSLVIGADNPSQVIENARLVEGEPFNQETLDEIEKRFVGVPDWIFMPYLWDAQN